MTQQIMNNLQTEFWKSAGVMTFTQVALKQLADSVPFQPTPENPDPNFLIGKGDPNDLGTEADASWRKSDLDTAANPNGWLQQWLTDAWIALIYARWERHYRPAFAQAHTVAESKVRCDVIGDVRNLRNDVIHHGGIATAKNTGKCKILTTIALGQRIILTPTDMRLLLANLRVEVEPDDAPK